MAAITCCSIGLPSSRLHSSSSTISSSSSSTISSSFAFSNPPRFPRLFVSHGPTRLAGQIVCCVSQPETPNAKKASIDLKLPRRSLLVSFTCNACDVRSQRLINRVAYERGTVFLQCSGCLQYHKFVDNLELVVEYNLLEDGVTDSNPN